MTTKEFMIASAIGMAAGRIGAPAIEQVFLGGETHLFKNKAEVCNVQQTSGIVFQKNDNDILTARIPCNNGKQVELTLPQEVKMLLLQR